MCVTPLEVGCIGVPKTGLAHGIEVQNGGYPTTIEWADLDEYHS